VIPAQESDRTRVGATCSRAFKDKVADYAERRGKTVADVVIMALADLLLADVLEQEAAARAGARQDEPAGRRT
jgi:hypothetical protein